MTIPINLDPYPNIKRYPYLNFRIRSSAAGRIVGGSVGLGKGDQDHLLTCNKKRSDRKTLIDTLTKEYKDSLNLKPDLPPEPPKGSSDRTIKAYERKVERAEEKVKKIQETLLGKLEKAEKDPILTENQDEKERLILEKQANPTDLLPDGLKSYAELWKKEQMFMRKKTFTSQQTEKGKINEDQSIELVKDIYNLGFVKKNEIWYEDSFKHGTPDLIFADEIWDIKNSYDFDTLPIYEKSIKSSYFWQGISYCDLLKDVLKKKLHELTYRIVYVLTNMPEKQLESKTWFELEHNFDYRNMTYDQVYEIMTSRYTYDGLPDELRVKRFHFIPDEQSVRHLHERVELCRQYIDQVLFYDLSEKTYEQISHYHKAA